MKSQNIERYAKYTKSIVNPDVIMIIKYIKDHSNDVKTIKKYLKHIQIEKLNKCYRLLEYLIENNFSNELIKYVIDLPLYEKITNHLFISIEVCNFEISDYLLSKGLRISDKSSICNYNILEFLANGKSFSFENLFYVFRKYNNINLITTEFLNTLIRNCYSYDNCKHYYSILKYIFEYSFFNPQTILKILYISKYQYSLSDKQFNEWISQVNGEIIININGDNTNGYITPLCTAVYYDQIKIFKLLLEYAKKNRINITCSKDNIKYTHNIMRLIIEKRNIEMLKLLIKYFNKANIKFDFKNDDFPLYYNKKDADKEIEIEILQILLDYSFENNFIFDFNNSHRNGTLIKEGKIEMIKFMMEYSKKVNIIINDYAILKAYKNGLHDMLESIINFAKEKKIKINFKFKRLYNFFSNPNYEKIDNLLFNYIVNNKRNRNDEIITYTHIKKSKLMK